MIEAGEPLATGTTYTLTNKALVTHIDSRAGVDVTIYEIFVQDNTAGLYIETYFGNRPLTGKWTVNINCRKENPYYDDASLLHRDD